MKTIDLVILQNCDFYPWLNEDNDLLEQIKFLKNIDIHNQIEVCNTIKALEILEFKLMDWLNKYQTLLNEYDIVYLLGLYRKHLSLVKEHEGVNFEKALCSLKMCLRMLQFVMCALYDFPDPIFGNFDMPDEIRNIL